MNFIKKEIKPKLIGIIDIGTYKIRVGICKIINKDVELIGYGEKRQDEEYIVMQEFQNLEGISENIKQAIKKAEIDGKIEIDDFMINIPSSNLFFEYAKINHIRENTGKDIDEKELYVIMNIVESIALKKHFKNIKENSGYKKNDLKLIISYISNILSDKKEVKKLIKTNPKQINISLLNIFIAESKYETISYIQKHIGKNILNIIPSEYSLIGLFNNTNNVVIIDLGNSHTSIIVKQDSEFIGAKKIPFGINDLIKQIRKNYNLTKNDIINSIDLERFILEKKEFLDIFKDVLTISLEEILKEKVCPNDFFMIGGGSNKFVKNYIKNTELNINNLKISGEINFILPKFDFIDLKIQNNPDWIDEIKSNINMYAMIKSSLDFIKKEKNIEEITLKKVISNIEK